MLFNVVALILYYLPVCFIKKERVGIRIQISVLLAASFAFYYFNVKNLAGGMVFFVTVIFSYCMGRLMEVLNRNSDRIRLNRFIFYLALIICASPLLLIKITPWFPKYENSFGASVIVPLGVSFYTLQIISYLCDCFSGKTKAEKNIFRYALFVSFFPQIVQGPIPRYEKLSEDLYKHHPFQIDNLTRGIQLIIWGCFLKLMIADKAAVPVNKIFNNAEQYTGAYILIAGVLFSIQLYTDFYSCVTICQGVANLYGIQIEDNFNHPYLALSIQDFWRRWHITLSSWLRDYIYIPLGGSRKGRIRTYVNILIVFLVSGLWHGEGYTFLIWGLMHGLYQIFGKITLPVRNKAYSLLNIRESTEGYRILKRIGTFFWVTIAWIVFRAKNLETALRMFQNLFEDFNPWVIFGKARFSYGLDIHEWFVLVLAILVLIFVSICQERGNKLREIFARQNLIIRWTVYLLAICSIWVFGTYGYGFDAADFIYGGF